MVQRNIFTDLYMAGFFVKRISGSSYLYDIKDSEGRFYGVLFSGNSEFPPEMNIRADKGTRERAVLENILSR